MTYETWRDASGALCGAGLQRAVLRGLRRLRHISEAALTAAFNTGSPIDDAAALAGSADTPAPSPDYPRVRAAADFFGMPPWLLFAVTPNGAGAFRRFIQSHMTPPVQIPKVSDTRARTAISQMVKLGARLHLTPEEHADVAAVAELLGRRLKEDLDRQSLINYLAAAVQSGTPREFTCEFEIACDRYCVADADSARNDDSDAALLRAMFRFVRNAGLDGDPVSQTAAALHSDSRNGGALNEVWPSGEASRHSASISSNPLDAFRGLGLFDSLGDGADGGQSDDATSHAEPGDGDSKVERSMGDASGTDLPTASHTSADLAEWWSAWLLVEGTAASRQLSIADELAAELGTVLGESGRASAGAPNTGDGLGGETHHYVTSAATSDGRSAYLYSWTSLVDSAADSSPDTVSDAATDTALRQSLEEMVGGYLAAYLEADHGADTSEDASPDVGGGAERDVDRDYRDAPLNQVVAEVAATSASDNLDVRGPLDAADQALFDWLAQDFRRPITATTGDPTSQAAEAENGVSVPADSDEPELTDVPKREPSGYPASDAAESLDGEPTDDSAASPAIPPVVRSGTARALLDSGRLQAGDKLVMKYGRCARSFTEGDSRFYGTFELAGKPCVRWDHDGQLHPLTSIAMAVLRELGRIGEASGARVDGYSCWGLAEDDKSLYSLAKEITHADVE